MKNIYLTIVCQLPVLSTQALQLWWLPRLLRRFTFQSTLTGKAQVNCYCKLRTHFVLPHDLLSAFAPLTLRPRWQTLSVTAPALHILIAPSAQQDSDSNSSCRSSFGPSVHSNAQHTPNLHLVMLYCKSQASTGDQACRLSMQISSI